MRPFAILAVAGALLVGLTPSSNAADLPPIDEYVPTFTRADLFLHRNTSPLGNLDANEGRFLRWDTTAPTGSQPALYHGNNYEVFVGDLHDPVHFLTMKGTVTGDLDTTAFDLYFTGWAQSTIGCGLSLSLQLIIDGQEIVSQDYTGSEGFNFTPVDDTTVKTRFALTHLWDATKVFELSYGPDVQHEIYLNVQNFYACNELTWQYDSADRASGLIVNLDKPGKKGYFEFNVLEPPPPLPAQSSTPATLARQ